MPSNAWMAHCLRAPGRDRTSVLPNAGNPVDRGPPRDAGKPDRGATPKTQCGPSGGGGTHAAGCGSAPSQGRNWGWACSFWFLDWSRSYCSTHFTMKLRSPTPPCTDRVPELSRNRIKHGYSPHWTRHHPRHKLQETKESLLRSCTGRMQQLIRRAGPYLLRPPRTEVRRTTSLSFHRFRMRALNRRTKPLARRQTICH